jgi:hypothetical protein
MDLKCTARHAPPIAAKDTQIRRAVARGRCARGHVHPGVPRGWASLEERARWRPGTMTAGCRSEDGAPRRVSSLMTTTLGSTESPQPSVPVRVVGGLPCWWWHFVAPAVAGAHHALHSTLAFGPAISVTMIDRTVARNTERPLTARGKTRASCSRNRSPDLRVCDRRRVRGPAEFRG